MGYDGFNLLESMPEYTADVGIKKGDKVDEAIFLHGNWLCWLKQNVSTRSREDTILDCFDILGQPQQSLQSLRTGICYKFYTDLDEPD